MVHCYTSLFDVGGSWGGTCGGLHGFSIHRYSDENTKSDHKVVYDSIERNEVDRNQLVTFKLEGGIHNRPLAVIYKKGRVLTPALRSFVQLMKDGAQ